jgi:hypothetical protein
MGYKTDIFFHPRQDNHAVENLVLIWRNEKKKYIFTKLLFIIFADEVNQFDKNTKDVI